MACNPNGPAPFSFTDRFPLVFARPQFGAFPELWPFFVCRPFKPFPKRLPLYACHA
jgi:hypothetical protein